MLAGRATSTMVTHGIRCLSRVMSDLRRSHRLGPLPGGPGELIPHPLVFSNGRLSAPSLAVLPCAVVVDLGRTLSAGLPLCQVRISGIRAHPMGGAMDCPVLSFHRLSA